METKALLEVPPFLQTLLQATGYSSIGIFRRLKREQIKEVEKAIDDHVKKIKMLPAESALKKKFIESLEENYQSLDNFELTSGHKFLLLFIYDYCFENKEQNAKSVQSPVSEIEEKLKAIAFKYVSTYSQIATFQMRKFESSRQATIGKCRVLFVI